MIVTVFRSRLKDGARAEYDPLAAQMSALARAMPGYIAHKVFTAEDGERVTIVEFEDEETQRAWAMHPDHRAAQAKGRRDFYAEYSLQICEVKRVSRKAASDELLT
ncbi:MAG: antibiotic biosynthesis monooxygenase [Hyphomicrobiales bacterium]|nr:antibiotic biosynthesis monooxygenase [Hyphomicrobiales bacterium]